jgi:hypothetical protein
METTEIKRYQIDYSLEWNELLEDPQGEWVRWEDVKDLQSVAKKLDKIMSILEAMKDGPESESEDARFVAAWLRS